MDIQTINSGWINVYTTAGIIVGTGLEVQNKNSNLITIQESATQPSAEDYSGRLLRYCDVAEVWAGSPGVWVRGATNSILLNVQAVPA
ncbi:hypothetical protein RDI61_15820 [Pseudomonas plecoglossicida]|uniref:hypothetical protein n=1 Tax=Pseudomonas putida group TaxID=136845 RepID=UPI00240EB2B9|nr:MULTISPECIES: hypothetical protein [Pseudomonas putida group]MDQ7965502.1 hypothetical protein [Pseudomonas plecoglossicida]WFG03783.1 hypothetical protein P3X84_03895 [Pseudomonas putida]